MSSKYWLPCVCGEQIAIEPRQAGETVGCRCGHILQAPTMREIRALEPAPEDALPQPQATLSWGWRHGLRLLGGATAVVAICWALWLYLNPPISRFDAFNPEMIRSDAATMPPAVTWDSWQKAKEGLDRRVDNQYACDVDTHRGLYVAAMVLAIAGIGLIIVGAVPAGRRAAASAT
ncbi:MAG: hypothetical protein LLG00_14775 [Planctomycetaceae bacterium]|nr:hypothetical protein [Planctomycetaceae bacterium]